MSSLFPKSDRLLKRREYQRLNRFKKRIVGEWIIIDAVPSIKSLRLGVTVSKKYGKAHERNRFKRIVKESFRLSKNQIKNSLDINVRPRSKAKKAAMADVQKELIRLLNR